VLFEEDVLVRRMVVVTVRKKRILVKIIKVNVLSPLKR